MFRLNVQEGFIAGKDSYPFSRAVYSWEAEDRIFGGFEKVLEAPNGFDSVIQTQLIVKASLSVSRYHPFFFSITRWKNCVAGSKHLFMQPPSPD